MRRSTILETAAAALAEMPVSELTLTELARRVGLAKSNVLRYFESREAVLLELLTAAMDEWLPRLDAELARTLSARAPAARRADQVVSTIVGTLAGRPVLCDLLSAQTAVLEHNISVDVAARYKRDMVQDLGVLATTVRAHLPELSARDGQRFGAAVLLLAGSVRGHAAPSAAMRAAYQRDGALAALDLDFTASLRDLLAPLLTGLLAVRHR